MTSTDFHLRNLIGHAVKANSRAHVDDAFVLIEANADRFGGDLAPELLVIFAEVASDVGEREDAVFRALQLYERLKCEDDQFKVRSLLTRCVYEARQGTDKYQLKGLHALQQMRYALSFLTDASSGALTIARKPAFADKYGFLIYNLSLVFWDVVRPMCRAGWQRHLVQDMVQILDALKEVQKAGGGGAVDPKAKAPAGGGGAAVPVSVDSAWVIELTLAVAFTLEDVGDAGAAKRADDANALVEEILKQTPEPDASTLRLKNLVLNARAYLSRKAGPGKLREEIDKASGSTVMGTVLFVRNGGIPKESAEEELTKAWISIDSQFNLREAKEKYDPKVPLSELDAPRIAPREEKERVQKVLDLASVVRAACSIGCWKVAEPALARLEKYQMPAGCGRIIMDLCKAEVSVHQACNYKEVDPVSKMLLSPEQQQRREVEARVQAIKLCEQCIMAAKRLDQPDLVEDSAVVMAKIGRELMCDEHRRRIHRSLQKASEILEEIQSIRLAELRVQLHFEVARCEVASDLLTKGQAELQKSQGIDYTAVDSELSEDVKKYLAEPRDPAPYLRSLEPAMHEQERNLHWKTNLFEDATDVIDQETLALDQVQKNGPSKKALSIDTMQQSFAKLQDLLEELGGDHFQELPTEFVPPPRTIKSSAPLLLLPHTAPATISPDGPRASEIQITGQTAPQPILDQRPKSEREQAVVRVKKAVALLCKMAREAYKLGEIDFTIEVCNKAISTSIDDFAFGPPPVEVEGALLLAESAYIKAQCLSQQLEEYAVINGVDDEIDEEPADSAADLPAAVAKDADEEENEPLTQEEKEQVCVKKKELIAALLYGIQKSREFKQWWMVTNGLVHWWNLHVELVETSHEQPKLLTRLLQEYSEGLKEIQQFFYGTAEWQVPDGDLDRPLVARLILAHVETSVADGKLGVLETDNLLALKRLGASERKQVIARVTKLCKEKDKPLPDLAKLGLDRLAGGGAPAAAAPKKGAAPPPPIAGADKSDLQGNEAEIMLSMISANYEKDEGSAFARVQKAIDLLGAWEPKQNDEDMLTLWVEMWTRLGRSCLREPLNPSVGRKHALMCGIKGLGTVDAATPKHASKERLRWRGACHGLCGEVFRLLVESADIAKESVLQLRSMAAGQFKRCCNYALDTRDESLAAYGARKLWNVSLHLLDSGETRQLLIEPFLAATRSLGAVKFQEDPFFFVGLYVALFDCYSDRNQWDAIHEMLNEAFAVVPDKCHRRLWSLRMLALSKQGKNVVMAMSRMKESQAKAQAGIWMILAHESAKRIDQFDAYATAIKILEAAEQPEVVEVRMEFADWLMRNGFGAADAKEQLIAAAAMLLDVEEEDEDEEEEDVDDIASRGGESGQSSAWDRSDSRSQRSTGSRVSRKSRASVARSAGGRSRGSRVSRSSKRSKGSRSTRSKQSRSKTSASVASKAKKAAKAEEDEQAVEQLFSHHFEMLLRTEAMRSQLCGGNEIRGALLSAVHFAVRFFASTVELANSCTVMLANQPPAALEAATATGTGGSFAAQAKKKDDEMIFIKPAFTLPARLTDWALEKNCPWIAESALLAEVFAKAQQADVMPMDSVSWAGHTDAIPKPPVTFHTLVRLVRDLAEQGLHLWVFPVIAMLLQLADSFEKAPVKDSITCLAYMMLSRYASECRLIEAADAATSKWTILLPKVSERPEEQVKLLKEELEQVKNQRSGRSTAGGQGSGGDLDQDWIRIESEATARVSAPWKCGELRAYEVWSELGNECRLHGELYQACTLTKEAIEHATAHGDRRTLRSLYILKARLAYDEGRYADAVRTIKLVTAADLQHTVDIALLLSDVYQATQQIVLATEVLKDALQAINASPETQAGVVEQPGKMADAAITRSSAFILRNCEARHALVQVEITRFALLTPNNDWIKSLNDAFESHEETMKILHANSHHQSRIQICVQFAKAIEPVLEAKRVDLMRDKSFDVRNGGKLSFPLLVSYASRLCDAMFDCQAARDALLLYAVPNEGVASGSITPAQVICASLDVWYSRVLALRRSLRIAADIDQQRFISRSHHVKTGANFTSRPRAVGTSADEGPIAGDAERAAALEREIAHKTGQLQRAQVNQRDLTEAHIKAVAIDADRAVNWEYDISSGIGELDRKKNAARELDEVESSIGLVSNAATVLQLLVDRSDRVEGAPVPELPACRTEALVELGRLHLELGAAKWGLGKLQPGAPGAKDKWEQAGSDWREIAGMELAERCTNVLHGRDPAELYKAKHSDEEAPMGAELKGSNPLPYDAIGVALLCDAAKAAAGARQYVAGKRALQGLAFEAYGASYPEATFDFLIWLQSMEVCNQAQEYFKTLLPHEHKEAIQQRSLHQLERTWTVPQPISAYQTIANRLQRESPMFQRFQLSTLPSVSDILLSYVPPQTLVVTLQVHDDHLYVGAVCTSPEGEATKRLQQLRHFVTRMPMLENELHICIHRLRELDAAIEKELVTSISINESHLADYKSIIEEFDHLMSPIFKELELHFWQNGLSIEHVCNPKQVVFLPDSLLWRLPLERLESVLRLFGKRNHSALSRDLSLHLLAHRAARVVEDPATGERKPLQARVPARPPCTPETTSLLTDTFNEDELFPSEKDKPEKYEVLNVMHKRLVDAKGVISERLSLNGRMFTVSPADIQGMLADSMAFFSLGFGNFFNLISMPTFASQDLRHVAVVGIFHRAINFPAFRRQTKAESSKTPRQASLESPYGTALVAGFRGAQCTLMASAPVPIAVSARCLEIVLRALHGGKTIGKALEDALNVQLASSDLRYSRTIEGGLLPGGVPVSGAAAADPKADPKKGAPKAESPVPPEAMEDWLPLHMRGAYNVVGIPWVVAEADAPVGKKK